MGGIVPASLGGYSMNLGDVNMPHTSSGVIAPLGNYTNPGFAPMASVFSQGVPSMAPAGTSLAQPADTQNATLDQSTQDLLSQILSAGQPSTAGTAPAATGWAGLPTWVQFVIIGGLAWFLLFR